MPSARLLEESGTSSILVDMTDGQVLECSGPLFSEASEALCGRNWEDALGLAGDGGAAIIQALAAGVAVQLPPTILQLPHLEEIVVNGLVLPQRYSGRETLVLLLRPMKSRDGDAFIAAMGDGDSIAVLGIDRLEYSPAWGVPETARLMMEVRSSLQQVARERDVVGLPTCASIPVILREVDPEGALDLCRAMLSHVNNLLAAREGGAAHARACIGLARRFEEHSALQVLVTANNTLSRLQTDGSEEQVRFASPWDALFLAARAVNAPGVFADAGQFVQSSHYLESLTAVEIEPLHPDESCGPDPGQPGSVQPMEKGIEGYVEDNMEGAIDQAVFLAGVDMPVAIIGPGGTGKMYVAQVIHSASGNDADALVQIDCRGFRTRGEALGRITRELEVAEGKTLVFKSPHLMHPEAQSKLARQLSTRTLAHADGPRYLPRAKFVALFPDSLEYLMRHGGLQERLASVFAGYPILVPPIKDRKRAVLRWAHKILEQESTRLDRRMLGFTPDAEQALLWHDWPGNISEMRELIRNALEATSKEWLTPVDLGLYQGISASGSKPLLTERPFLQQFGEPEEEVEYVTSAYEGLREALGQALHSVIELEMTKPLGAWLDDEIVLAACERYRDDTRGAAQFLMTRPRNIGRWMPKILARDHERSSSLLWQECRQFIRRWIGEAASGEEAPQKVAREMLMSHVLQQCGDLSVAERAAIMGVSVPTYQKRLKQLLQDV